MPCYHFSVQGEPRSIADGVELADMDHARLEAVRLAGALLNDAPADFWRGQGWNLDVCNCDRAVLFTLSLNCRDGEGAEAASFCPTDEHTFDAFHTVAGKTNGGAPRA